MMSYFPAEIYTTGADMQRLFRASLPDLIEMELKLAGCVIPRFQLKI